MIELLISVALLSGAEQNNNTITLNKEVILRVEAQTGMNVFSIQEDAHFRLKKDHANFVLQITGQEHNGAD